MSLLFVISTPDLHIREALEAGDHQPGRPLAFQAFNNHKGTTTPQSIALSLGCHRVIPTVDYCTRPLALLIGVSYSPEESLISDIWVLESRHMLL